MSRFDYFAAPLKCNHCGQVSLSDDSADIQTYIDDFPDMRVLTVGDHLHFKFEDLEDKHYFILKTPESENYIKILQDWQCENCYSYNWMLIEIVKKIISSMEAVELDTTAVKGAHAISFAIEEFISEETGMSRKQVLESSKYIREILLRLLERESAGKV